MYIKICTLLMNAYIHEFLHQCCRSIKLVLYDRFECVSMSKWSAVLPQ